MNLRKLYALGGSARKALVACMLLGLLGIAAGCSDDNNNGTGPNPTQPYRDLTLNLNGMETNLTQRMEARVVSTANDSVIAVAVVDPVSANDTVIVMPKALVTGHDYRVDIYVDANANGVYDVPPVDRSWSLPVPVNGVVNFTANTNYTDISAAFNTTGQPLTVNFTGFDPMLSGLMELRVVENSTGRTIGVYRHSGIIAPSFAVTVPAVIENGTAYHIDFFTDVNMNGDYDAPPTDFAWRVNGTGEATGLTINFTRNEDYTDVAF